MQPHTAPFSPTNAPAPPTPRPLSRGARKAPPRGSNTGSRVAALELRTSGLHPDDQALLDSGVPVVCVDLYTRR